MMDAGELCNRQVVIATPEEPNLVTAREREELVAVIGIAEEMGERAAVLLRSSEARAGARA